MAPIRDYLMGNLRDFYENDCVFYWSNADAFVHILRGIHPPPSDTIYV